MVDHTAGNKTAANWRPDSWKDKPVSQQIKYGDNDALAQVTEKLCQLPPLVSTSEVDTLKARIAEAQAGERFIVQGGDCAESFSDCNADAISQKVRSLLSLSLLVSQKTRQPITRIGRIAGQYAKPRSELTETQGDTTLTSYRGDLVNHVHFTESARTPDPARMLEGYSYASLTLNYIRSLLEGDLEELFNLDEEVNSLKALAQHKELHQSLSNFRQAINLFHQFNGRQTAHKNLTEFYTSHEALHLHYEQALTRQASNGRWYNLSTHFPWVGMRTVRTDSAHLEYLRGIANPIAIKVGPTVAADNLIDLCQWLNPTNEPGKLTLTQRFGHQDIAKTLPEMIQAIQKADLKVLWSCDPMHGNTHVSNNGYKTRDFQHIQSELQQAFDIHKEYQSHLGAIHLEMTGQPVMECIGSRYSIHPQDLGKAYTSLVDPRLNLSQAFELIDSLFINQSQTAPNQQKNTSNS
ncbi:3-deoxy-7-phosphoheptulonate synthase class II [Kangiella marina]|uniref:Phospho-2-dehydro-3-deoxyheptonate aldolase n=1 Tax=Kangiella marina TaxID=1079178 RepID=A0ABP8IFR3_9GAMM